MREPKSVGLCIVLSIVTCGIYGIYWLYCIHEDMKAVCGLPMNVSGGMLILLTIVTCGIYGMYWSYQVGRTVDAAKGTPNGSLGVLYLVLSIFGLNIVAWALMQNEINQFMAA